MNSRSLIKRELLRRKIKEHWEKNPTAKSLIVKANFNGIKTFWRVVKEGKSHLVTEVDTKKEVFLLGEVGWPYVDEQDEDKKEKKSDKKEKKDKEKNKKEQPPKGKEPIIPDAKPPGEMATDPVDKDVGLDKGQPAGVSPGEMGAEDDELSAELPEKPKTRQETELQKIVHKKPLVGVDVNTDENAGHVILRFPGEGNDVTIDVLKDGKVVYTYKDRPRLLKTGAVEAGSEMPMK